mgnify:CR=1 FL=1
MLNYYYILPVSLMMAICVFGEMSTPGIFQLFNKTRRNFTTKAETSTKFRISPEL